MTLTATPIRRAITLNGGSAAPRRRILCVDDHAIVFKGLKAGLQTEEDLLCVGWRGDASDLISAVDETSATIVLIDVDMPGVSAFEAIEDLHRARPDVRAIVLSAFTRDHYIDSALAAGAWGYLSKSDDFEAIIAAIRRVAGGEFAFGPAALARCEMVEGRLRLKSAPQGAAPGVSRLSALTAQEVQVLRLIATGASTREIASAIHRSEKRVEAIRTNILKKLDLEDRVELTRFAIREGLVEP
jgi:DNA-binding NarL/FixJ family response regulator